MPIFYRLNQLVADFRAHGLDLLRESVAGGHAVEPARLVEPRSYLLPRSGLGVVIALPDVEPAVRRLRLAGSRGFAGLARRRPTANARLVHACSAASWVVRGIDSGA